MAAKLDLSLERGYDLPSNTIELPKPMSKHLFSPWEFFNIVCKTSDKPILGIVKLLFSAQDWVRPIKVQGKIFLSVSPRALMKLWGLKSPAPIELRLDHLRAKGVF